MNSDEKHNERAADLLMQAYSEGALIVAPVTYTELSADSYFQTASDLDAFLEDTGIRVEEPNTDALFRAGDAFQTYLDRRGEELQCSECGTERVFDCPNCNANVTARQHVPADFLIGAQAETQADQLLTFDGGFFETYFTLDIRSF
nr:nucleotide-binding protein [Halorussus salinus]